MVESTNDKEGRRIHITGIVQGVGFRPFIYALAIRNGLHGWVRNSSAGVDIAVEGKALQLAAFMKDLEREQPPLAFVDEMTISTCAADGFNQFEIVDSQTVVNAFQPISADVSICTDCLRELFDPSDRHHRYPFTNCTNCGPRFTITKDIPYDRPLTTMAPFAMCPECVQEYMDPGNRRFHAQPVACPDCGPGIWLELVSDGKLVPGSSGDSAITECQALLKAGKILAIKGLGGFHLACDALNATAVATLRQRKLRREKPFALMLPDLETVRTHCFLNELEAQTLQSHARPIVLLRKRPHSPIVADCAPGQLHLGVMLPYTPLHYLLLEKSSSTAAILVMTSGNISEEPIAFTNDDARTRLAPLADALLLHNREIHIRCDDSVMRVLSWPADQVTGTAATQMLPLRRSRGYAPFPVRLPMEGPPALAVGAEMKNTFCLSRGRYGFLSHHIGEMENYETYQSFRAGITHFEKLFRVNPELIAYDLHPDYLASRYARERAAAQQLSAVGVQHHHAHIASVLAENLHPGDRPVIGLSFDGTGYGEDGAIWGGECLLADYAGYSRSYHLRYIPLAGGDKAVRQPWRLALAWLLELGIDFPQWQTKLAATLTSEKDTPVLEVVKNQITKRINAPLTSSMGRLFDAVAALAGVRLTVNYEAQAAMELEALLDHHEQGAYSFALNPSTGVIDPQPLFVALIADLQLGVPTPCIAARFHNGVAQMVLALCRAAREASGLQEVALSGGVWQNGTLLKRSIPLLEENGFAVYRHSRVPPNDGGLALGQTAVAVSKYQV